ncbi:hypothetical protein GN956_G4459 [Arapaima gigas]
MNLLEYTPDSCGNGSLRCFMGVCGEKNILLHFGTLLFYETVCGSVFRHSEVLRGLLGGCQPEMTGGQPEHHPCCQRRPGSSAEEVHAILAIGNFTTLGT